MSAVRSALGLPGAEPVLDTLRQWGGVRPGTPVQKGPPLFPRIQLQETEPSTPVPEPKKTPDDPQPDDDEDGAGVITFDDPDRPRPAARPTRIAKARPSGRYRAPAYGRPNIS